MKKQQSSYKFIVWILIIFSLSFLSMFFVFELWILVAMLILFFFPAGLVLSILVMNKFFKALLEHEPKNDKNITTLKVVAIVWLTYITAFFTYILWILNFGNGKVPMGTYEEDIRNCLSDVFIGPQMIFPILIVSIFYLVRALIRIFKKQGDDGKLKILISILVIIVLAIVVFIIQALLA